MSVYNRIKILKVNSLEEVETKVNDFLAFDEHIAQLVHIDYMLESNFVIIEYYVMNNSSSVDKDNNNNNNNNNNKMVIGSGDYSYAYTPFTSWLKLCFPFYPN
jgi:alpha-D-ribose 1-methylphosphonate 5-phosphate C-P lyase